MARIWDDILSERDRAVYRGAGYGGIAGGGQSPALLVIDVTFDFTGDVDEPILESQKKYPNSCGEAAWEGMKHIRDLLDLSHELDIPVFYTRGLSKPSSVTRGAWAWKKTNEATIPRASRDNGNTIPDLVAPGPRDTVIEKTKPSGFFGTPLGSYLTGLGCDTVIVTGTTTSGCIRATVLDSFSLNFHTLVAEEAVFDRGELTHKVNLFDMHQKYSDVCTVAEVKRYMRQVKAGEALAAVAD